MSNWGCLHITDYSINQVIHNLQETSKERWIWGNLWTENNRIFQKTDLVNEVESHCPLTNPHLLGLPILTVLGPNLVHTLVESPGRLVLLPIFLSLTTIHNNINHVTSINKMLNSMCWTQCASVRSLPSVGRQHSTWRIWCFPGCFHSSKQAMRPTTNSEDVTRGAHTNHGTHSTQRKQPKPYLVVMANFLPLVSWWRAGYLSGPKAKKIPSD